MKKPLTLSIIILLFAFRDAKADRFIMDGDTLGYWYTSPLRQYPGYATLQNKLSDFEVPSCFDCCGEIFDAEWTVIDGQLYLTNIYNNPHNDKRLKADINQLFKVTNGRVKADWVTAEVWLPVGRVIDFIDVMQSFYAKEIRLKIINGKVVDKNHIDYPENFDATEEKNVQRLEKFVYTNINWNLVDKVGDKKVIVGFIIGISNQLQDITIIKPAPGTPWADEVKRVLSLATWQAPYWHGKPVKQVRSHSFKFTADIRAKYNP